MARREHGYKKIDEIVWEDGTKYPITVHKETGEFRVVIPDPASEYRNLASFTGKDLQDIRDQATAWLKDNSTLDWEPVIIIRGAERIGGRRHAEEYKINLDYKRFFRAKRKNSSYLWKEFAGDKHLNEAGKDEVEGQPGRPCGEPYGFVAALVNPEDNDCLVLPYTAERWSALRTISLLIRNLNERVNALLDQGKLDDMLLSIAQRGAQALLPAPKEDR